MDAVHQDPIPYRRQFLVLCAVWLVLNFVVLKGGRVLPWDAINEFYPTVYFNAHSLRSGLAPWWNPYIYSGYAQIGDPQGMLFSPLLMTWMLLPAQPGVVWFCWGVLLHMLMAGAAMLEVLRRHGANALGALVGATVFMGGGVAASRLEHISIVIAYAYVPVVLLALRYFLSRPGALRGALLGLAAGALVVHLVQATYLFVLMLVAYACVAAIRYWRSYDSQQRMRFLGGGVVALLVAVACGLPQLLFSWAAMGLSNRSMMPLSVAAPGSLDLRSFLFLFYPNAFDGLRNLLDAPIDPVQSFLYIGTLPLLALGFVVRAWHRGRNQRSIACFSVLALAGALYMLGTHTPLYGWLYTWLPGLVHFRRPSDGAYVFNIALAFLAAVGASHIDLASWKERLIVASLASAWLVASLVAMGHVRTGQIVAILVAMLVVWNMRHADMPWRATLWLMLLVVADYRSFNFNGRFNVSSNETARYLSDPAVHYLKQALDTSGPLQGERIATEKIAPIWDNGGMLTGIASTQGYNPLRHALYETWYPARENAMAAGSPSLYNGMPERRMDDLLGVRYLAIGGMPGAPVEAPPDYRKVGEFDDIVLWRNDSAYPRFMNPTQVRLVGLNEPVDPAEFTRTDFNTVFWLTPRDETDQATARTSVSRCTGAVQIKAMSSTPTRTELRTEANSPGWVVAGELDHPGWEARLDGEQVPIHRANGMFRAVCVPKGQHRLTFAFSPWRMVSHAIANR
ncbi:hypothetical protein GCM10009552_05040 [Rothia nasimurium]|uniref:YfhO family protein n=1 Tax=Luteibacter anthropi TaxID=564369 RepID=A0A7X5UCK1_9GAMM|nr:YfhO family protein [Luteibacter anthropi]NII08006.1 YfhO family protein [Luteibacter anthropi]